MPITKDATPQELALRVEFVNAYARQRLSSGVPAVGQQQQQQAAVSLGVTSEDGVAMNDDDDIDGVAMPAYYNDNDDVDGVPMDDNDIDGAPMESLDDDIDGVPLGPADVDDDIDGIPLQAQPEGVVSGSNDDDDDIDGLPFDG